VGDAVSSLLNLGSAASLIMILGDISSVYIKATLMKPTLAKPNSTARKDKVESYPNESFDGVVQRIAPSGQDNNNVTTFECRVTISNPQGKLRVGMTPTPKSSSKNAERPAVPETALVMKGQNDVRNGTDIVILWAAGLRNSRGTARRPVCPVQL